MTTDRPNATALNLMDVEHTTQEEINADYMRAWRFRGPLYIIQANSLMFDHDPKFGKLHYWGAAIFGGANPVNVTLLSIQNVHSYMMLGWETGIRNEFTVMRRNGMPKEGYMELVMFSQLYAGMRGLGHVYHAIGDFLAVTGEPPDGAKTPWPEGWAVDREGFKAGIDMTTRSLTDSDRQRLTEWYEKTIGYLPASIDWGMKHHPEFIKVNRAKWENAIKTLPKQAAPYMMMRHHMIQGDRPALRESALLGKAWGITSERIVHGLCATAFYFTGFEGLYAAYDALEDIL
jgi:hypothetical protein